MWSKIKKVLLDVLAVWSKVWNKVKRVLFDILALISLFAILWFAPDRLIPPESVIGLFHLFITKFVLISCGILHAHITRKLLFPYIKFGTEKEWSNNVLIIVWYAVVIWGWARGG
jgi:hypothetical protein